MAIEAFSKIYEPTGAGAWELVYTVPAGKHLTISSIVIQNTDEAAERVGRVAILKSTDPTAPPVPTVKNLTIPAPSIDRGTPYVATIGPVLTAGMGIAFKAETLDVGIQIFGILADGAGVEG